MQAKFYPGKTLKKSGEKAGKTYKVKEGVSYYCPSMESILSHLQKAESLEVANTEEAQKYTETFGLPAYTDEFSAWLIDAIRAKAETKARSGITVTGDSEDSLVAEITGSVPQSLEDLLSTERGGGIYAEHKGQFLVAFEAWLSAEGESKPRRYLSALSRPTMLQTPRKAWPRILDKVESFIATLTEEESSATAVYIRSVRKQLTAPEEESDDWDDIPE